MKRCGKATASAIRPTSEIPANVMLDPSTDEAGREWCYLAKSTTVIGVPFQPDVTQVTFDGALYTKNAELCFFFGDKMTPLLARQKTFLEGWIPLVQYAWLADDVTYDLEMFAFPLADEDASNTVNFVSVTVSNKSTTSANARLMAAMRHSGEDNRMGGSPFDPAWDYEMTGDAVFRGGRLVYSFSPGAILEAVPSNAYKAPFKGAEFDVCEQTVVCDVCYECRLRTGESKALVFKMPRVPVTRNEQTFIDKVLAADYTEYRDRMVSYWRELVADSARFSIPEKRVNDSMRASLTHTLLASRARDGCNIQTDGLPYPNFFLTAAPQEGLIYLTRGLPELAKNLIVREAITQQEPDGLYFDRSLAHGDVIPTAHGHVLYIGATAVLFAQDKALAEEIFPSIARAVGYLKQATQTDEHGLLPPTYPYDNEMIDGHYASNNFWALLGLRQAVRLARFLGRSQEAGDWEQLETHYRAHILEGIEASATPDGYIPPGLYPYLTGRQARRGFAAYQTECDWENMLLAFPTELLDPLDPRVRGTVERVREGYAEGVMTYRHGQHLHQYITANQIEQYLVMGDSYTALKDLYHILLHAGSTHECFENLVSPWTDRHVHSDCPPPHAWASAKLGVLIRNFLLMEYGGLGGLSADKRELWLFHCLSPAWVRPGKKISISNAPTEFGEISTELSFSEDGATALFHASFHSPPAAYRIRIPYFKRLLTFRTDARESLRDGNCLVLSAETTTLSLEWEEKPDAHIGTFEDILSDYRRTNLFMGVDKDGGAVINRQEAFLLNGEKQDAPQPLSFELVVRAFRHEYLRRAEACKTSGGAWVVVDAPSLGLCRTKPS